MSCHMDLLWVLPRLPAGPSAGHSMAALPGSHTPPRTVNAHLSSRLSQLTLKQPESGGVASFSRSWSHGQGLRGSGRGGVHTARLRCGPTCPAGSPNPSPSLYRAYSHGWVQEELCELQSNAGPSACTEGRFGGSQAFRQRAWCDPREKCVNPEGVW